MSLDLNIKHEGETTVYTSCRCNCGGSQQCVIKAHLKDGKVVAVEPDDRYNTNVGREDDALSEKDLLKVRLQRRPCVMGLAFHRYIYHPDRILYPLKRAPGTKRGEGKFVRISWDDALTTIAGKMNEAREKYGSYSVITSQRNLTAERLFSLWGAGVAGWGACSYDAARLMSHLIVGEKGWDVSQWSSGSAADMLANTKIIVLWGSDPTVGHQGPAHMFAWFIKLARERGIPVIIIDTRYSVAARTLADQWIPIKPGTDRAMFMAMAYVLFQEDLWNKEFVAKYVEPVGFEKWRSYVLGAEDGIAKTPEWAEIRCAVPAETIRDLARKVGTIKPTWLWSHWSVSRKSNGEQTVGAFTALQAMLGSWGDPGVGPSMQPGSYHPIPVSEGSTTWGPSGDYKVPHLYRSHYWAEAVLLLDKVRSGELGEEDYMRMVGWKGDPGYLKDFNPKFIFWGGGNKPHAANNVVTSCNSSNNQVKAFEKVEFVVTMHSIMNPTTQQADIILPAQDWMWEEKGVVRSASYGTFECINYLPEVVKPPGEVRHRVWVYVKIAEKLGIDPKKLFPYYTTDENWENDWEKCQKDIYQGVVDYYKKKNIDVPSWEEFIHGKFINCDELEDKPFTGWNEQIKEGKLFRTESGKIELYSRYVANEANRGKGEHHDTLGRVIDNLPSDWGDLTPSPTYKAMRRGMDDSFTTKYPLFLLTSHSRYRVHYLFWEHPWLRNHVYKHRVWINTADAGTRGIKDNDMIMVYNDRGKVVMPAYVTHRIMPGTLLIHAGGKAILDKEGVDFGASPSTLLGGDFDSCLASARATNLVQVEKYQSTLSKRSIRISN
ncbi:molybdopterin-dependent oxidoreductase [Chloroflexota bacterium]